VHITRLGGFRRRRLLCELVLLVGDRLRELGRHDQLGHLGEGELHALRVHALALVLGAQVAFDERRPGPLLQLLDTRVVAHAFVLTMRDADGKECSSPAPRF
jgi:hypothetical protein